MLRLLGKNVKKYRKYALATWIVIAMILVPTAIKIRTQGTASELEFIPKTESDRVMQQLQEEFPNIPASTILIVLQSKDVRQNWTRQFNDQLLGKLNNSILYGYNKTNSVYTVEKQINQKINKTIEDSLKEAKTKLTTTLAGAHENLTLLRDAVNQTNYFLYSTAGLLSVTWWNISRIVYYLNTLTTAYTDGLNETYLNIVTTVTGANNLTVESIYNQTRIMVNGTPLGVIMSNASLNDIYSYQMAFSFVNQTFSILLANNSQQYLFLSFLNLLNNTIMNNLISMHLNSNILASQYYPPQAMNSTEISKAMLSQANVLNLTSGLIFNSVSQAINNSNSVLPQELEKIFNVAWSLPPQPSLDLLNNATIEIILSQPESSQLFGDLFSSSNQQNMSVTITNETIYSVFMALLSPTYNESTPLILSQQLIDLISPQIYAIAPYVEFPNKYPHDIYSQFVSKDNNTMIFIVEFSESSQKTEIQENTPVIRQIIKRILKDINAPSDVKTYVSGEVAMFYDLQKVSEEDIGKTDVYTVIMVIGVLLLIFLSPITPFVPLFTIGIAIIVVYSIFYALSLVTEIPTMMLTLTTVVMMGAGVDYLVFLLSRYKEERENKQNDVDTAIENMVAHAGESIITSGLSVAIGFGILMVSSIKLLFWMGIGPLIGVIVSLIAALTIIPSILSYIGDKVYWPRMHVKKAIIKAKQSIQENIENNTNKKKKTSNSKNNNNNNHSALHNVAQWIVDHPKTVVVLFLIVSAPFVYAGINMKTSYDLTAQIPESQESVKGLKLMSDEFGASEVFPVYVLINLQNKIMLDNNTLNNSLFIALENVRQSILSLNTVSKVLGVTAPSGENIGLNATAITSVELEQIRNYIGKDNATVYFLVKLSIDPLSEKGINSVEDIKLKIRTTISKEPALNGSTFGVAGFGAQYLELNGYMEKDTPKLVAFVLIGLFILLVVALKSIVTPIRLQLTILLGVYISLGITDIVFRQILGEQISWMLPVSLFVMIFGLGMDYDIFLVTRIKEEVNKGKTDKEATVEALEATMGIISAAGIIMATAFASLLFSDLVTLRTIGFAIATAVLIDALFIRLILVPATMVLLEKWNWWLPFVKQNPKQK